MKKRVLIFPAGAENALEIYDSLRYNVNFEVYGASGKKDFAEYKYPKDKYIEGDFYINDIGFCQRFQSLIEEYKIDFVIPTHDTIALFLAENRNKFTADILVAPYETAKICREKKLMYQIVSDTDFVPITYNVTDDIVFPVFVKPNIGAGAVNAGCYNSLSELSQIENIEEYVICEMLPGKELSVDCYTNQKGELIFVGARSRDRIQMGIAFRSTTVEVTEEIAHIAQTLNERMQFVGAWYFQVKQDNEGRYKLLEVSCRQAGTMTLYRHLGINFPALGLFELMGREIGYIKSERECQVERCLQNAFKYDIDYENIYLDFDDTIIIDNKVCDVLIRFMYQCVNQNKKLYLITRHEGEMAEVLNEFRISPFLFDEIYHITFAEKKYGYINPEKSIFIDNSFVERKEVSEQLGIPVFDVDMVDMLLVP